MSTPAELRKAIEFHFSGYDQDIMNEILAALRSHYGSPWVFNQHAQPDAGVKVICLDVNELDGTTDVTTAIRTEGSDWTDPECGFWWMHIPSLPEGGAQPAQKSPENRTNTDFKGGAQGDFATLADTYAEAEAEAATLRASGASHEEINAAVDVANSARAELLEHARALVVANNKES